MGTTVQSITGAGRALPDSAQVGLNNPYYPPVRGGNWQQQPQHSIESPEGVFSPQSRSGAPAYGQNQSQNSTYEAQQAAAAVHQQEQRGVSQLQNAVATATGHPVPRNTLTPTPSAQPGSINGTGAQQPGIEKRGPVEFNHAISYVNKIKVSFSLKHYFALLLFCELCFVIPLYLQYIVVLLAFYCVTLCLLHCTALIRCDISLHCEILQRCVI
jgi:paired amphipathic helix protein Sin3a